MTTGPTIAIVTVCKARLAHLKQSLPKSVAQAHCVVVDYACPDGTAAWVRTNHPTVTIVQIDDSRRFSVAAGRNAGAAAAKSDWLCFLDADVVPAAHFLAAVAPLLQPGRFYRPWPVTEDNWGTLICRRSDFDSVGGYDVVFDGWGGEDDDLYQRLKLRGVAAAQFPAHLLSTIAHDDATRMRFHTNKDREISRRLNLAYMQVKNDLRAILGTEPAPEFRSAMFSEVQRVLSDSLRAGGQAQISVNLPDSALLPGWPASRTLVYTFPPTALTPPRIGAVAPMQLRDAGGRPPMPFVIGTGRSGSTLLRLMLDSHPALAIPDETHFIPRLARLAGAGADLHQLVEALRSDERWKVFGVSHESVLARAGGHSEPLLASLLRAFYESYAARFEKPRCGDKTPPYVFEMPLIRQLFPEARFVHLVRDGRDVALSMREKAWWGPRTLAELAAWWANTIATARAHGAGAPDYLEIRYEDLVQQPEATLRRICEFIELPWDAAMLRYHERASDRLQELIGFRNESGEYISTERVRALHTLTAKPPDASRIGAWRTGLSAAEIRQFELLAAPLLAAFGYETTG